MKYLLLLLFLTACGTNSGQKQYRPREEWPRCFGPQNINNPLCDFPRRRN